MVNCHSAIGHSLLAISYWLFAIGSLVIPAVFGLWLLAIGSLTIRAAFRDWQLAHGRSTNLPPVHHARRAIPVN